MNANETQNTTGSSQDHSTKNLGPCLKICQLNIEGISWAKCQVLHKILIDNDVAVVAIQETHAETEDQLDKRGKIPGYDLLGATYHRTYGVATYVRSTLENSHLVETSNTNNIHEVVTKVGEITISNIYKPPATDWSPDTLPLLPHPAVYAGDFNSHHTQWKYRTNDSNGETLMNWADENNIDLVFDAKERGSFKSAAWNQEYNPDLCFVSKDDNNIPLQGSRRILTDFPHSQHRPALIEIGIKIPLIKSFPRPRWNFKKADWESFSSHLDKCLGWITPTVENYPRFTKAMIASAKKTIPRGFREEYISGWNDNCEEQYQQFLKDGDREIADDLLRRLDLARREKWTETVANLDFKRSSREAWSLLKKLGASPKTAGGDVAIHPDKIANHVVSTSRTTRDKAHTVNVKQELRALKRTSPEHTVFSLPFRDVNITEALEDVKPGKAPGPDGIHPEFLLNSGKYTKKWLAEFFTDIMLKGRLPSDMKKSNVIAILKPGKSSDDPKSYRPIALLSSMYKLLERLLYNRIGAVILERIPIEQAGFRPGRSCTDQIMSLTTYIEAGFQKKLKTSAAFIDLSAAYDTVWRHGLLYKLIQVIPSRNIIQLIDGMLAGRSFRVILGNKISSTKHLNDGLPQGSVLAPLLFSLYICDMPLTTCRKFGYADDWVLAVGRRTFEETETILTTDLAIMGAYFRRWRLKPNPTKTETACFHLCNREANRQLRVYFGDNLLLHNQHPKYLGVTLDRTLSFKRHLENTSAKIRTRNNIIHKLCGTTWGSTADTLRTSALGLVYSAAEYGAPVWLNSAHTHKLDVQLNNTMRIISGTLRSTPTEWLPILSHIPPPDLRRRAALLREYKRIQDNPQLPIHQDVAILGRNRLRSRKPPMETAVELSHFNLLNLWERNWFQNGPPHCRNLPCIRNEPPAFDQPRRIWTTLNRIRTNHGRCADSLHKWGRAESPNCDCGIVKQTVRHIVGECPNRAYGGPFDDFLRATNAAIDYIKNLDVCL